MAAIGIAAIAEYVELRQKQGATIATIRRDLTTMRRVLAFARFKGLVERNAAEAFDRSMVRERRVPIRVPDDATIAAAIEACKQQRHRLGQLIRFLRGTGLGKR